MHGNGMGKSKKKVRTGVNTTKLYANEVEAFSFLTTAIETALMIKGILSLLLRALQGFIALTGLKVFGEGECKFKKHGIEKRRTWHKLHLALDVDAHEVVSAEVSHRQRW